MLQNMVSDQDLCCLLTRISMQNTLKIEHPLETPETRNGLTQMIRMDQSTSQKRVKL